MSIEASRRDEGNTIETALKKLVSNKVRHSPGVLSAILFAGVRVPWLMMRLSIRENDLSARFTTFGPT